jgi:hypothetical protein
MGILPSLMTQRFLYRHDKRVRKMIKLFFIGFISQVFISRRRKKWSGPIPHRTTYEEIPVIHTSQYISKNMYNRGDSRFSFLELKFVLLKNHCDKESTSHCKSVEWVIPVYGKESTSHCRNVEW